MSALHVHNNDKEAEEPLMSLQAYFAFVAACIALALIIATLGVYQHARDRKSVV